MTRGRTPKLTPDIENRIKRIQLGRKENGKPYLKAPATRTALLKLYLDNLKAQNLSQGDIARELNKADKKYFPGVSTIRKYLQILIPELDAPSPLDEPWSIGSSADISPDIIPVIIEIQKRIYNYQKDKPEEYQKMIEDIKEYAISEGRYQADGNVMTIRQVKWINKLYPALLQIARQRGDIVDIYALEDDISHSLSWLYPLACSYARLERVMQILTKKNTTFNTRSLDYFIFTSQKFFDLSTLEKTNLCLELSMI